LWLQGHEAIRAWFLGRGACCRGSRLLRVAASGAPAFAQYHPAPDGNGYTPWAILVLGTVAERVAEMTFFLDVETLFPRFGLPMRLAAERS
jgi:RNA polymerase sigma-70 factor, ECF subfamily